MGILSEKNAKTTGIYFSFISCILMCFIFFCGCSDNLQEDINSKETEKDYETYFSEEIEFEDIGIYTGGYSFGVNKSGGLYRYPSDTPVSEVCREFLFPEYFVGDYALVYEEIIFSVNGEMLCRSNLDGSDFEVIYELPESAKGNITKLFADEDVIWFQSGDTIYRFHRSSDTLDEIIKKEGLIFWNPLTNYSIRYDIYSEEYLEFIENGGLPIDWGLGKETVTYIYNSVTKEDYKAEFEEEPPYSIIYDIK